MTFSVTILGSNSAAPATNRHPTSQVVNVQDELFLIDCGEGTQMQISKYKIRFQKINNIFISHLHGDHYLGLIGLIFTYHLLSRQMPLHIYGTEELEGLIQLQLKLSNCRLVYPLEFHPVRHDINEIIYEDDKLTVETMPMKHSIPTSGFIFREKPKPRSINISALKDEKPCHYDYKKIKQGEDYISPGGVIYKNADITLPPPPPRSYSHCSDTIYDENIIKYIKNTDLLYCETTFRKDKQQTASEKMHCTSEDAGKMAINAGVKKLIIGHFSARYEDDELGTLLEETKAIFPDSELAREGEIFRII